MRNIAKKTKARRGIRAFWDNEKQERELELVRGAESLFSKHEFANISIVDICNSVGLAKGTFYLYFDTKEEIFLKIAEKQFIAWGQILEETLSQLPPRSDEKIAARAFVSTLAGFQNLLRLFNLLHSIIEKNVSHEKIIFFKQAMLKIQSKHFELWSKIYPELLAEDLESLITFLSSTILGIWTLAHPPDHVKNALIKANLNSLIKPFEITTSNLIEIFLIGLRKNRN